MADRIPEDRFRKTVYIVLLFLGILLVVTPFTQKPEPDAADSGEAMSLVVP